MDGTWNAAERAMWKKSKNIKQRDMKTPRLSLHSTQALMLESEWKHAARQSLKALQGTEFFTLQIVYNHQVCGETYVGHNSTDVLYIQMLSMQVYNTMIPYLSEQWTDLKPWEKTKLEEVCNFSRLHVIREQV